MSKKRYAIVRVDDRFCPSHFEKIDDLNVCIEPKNLYTNKLVKCKDCRYGDTKEQLIRKVAQAIKIKLKADYVAGLKDTVFVTEWCAVERLAEKIIEFLGVK